MSTVPERRGRLRARSAAGRAVSALGLLVVLVAIWQAATMLAPSPFFPQPLRIGANLLTMLTTGRASNGAAVYGDITGTLGRLAAGFAIGAVGGLLVGVAMGLWRPVAQLTNPIVEFLRSIPATASLPLFIILLGGDDAMRVAFIAWGVSWFVVINTATGVATIHPALLQVGASFRVSATKRLFGIVLPAALPKIVAGLRIALTASLLLAVVSEFLLATNGIGFQLIQTQRRFQLLDMWSWMLLLGILGLLLNTILELVEGRALAWHRRSRGRGE
jgi:ABC-type nitrate/sulfonate/bicarbonate transport system permease component